MCLSLGGNKLINISENASLKMYIFDQIIFGGEMFHVKVYSSMIWDHSKQHIEPQWNQEHVTVCTKNQITSCHKCEWWPRSSI